MESTHRAGYRFFARDCQWGIQAYAGFQSIMAAKLNRPRHIKEHQGREYFNAEEGIEKARFASEGSSEERRGGSWIG